MQSPAWNLFLECAGPAPEGTSRGRTEPPASCGCPGPFSLVIWTIHCLSLGCEAMAVSSYLATMGLFLSCHFFELLLVSQHPVSLFSPSLQWTHFTFSHTVFGRLDQGLAYLFKTYFPCLLFRIIYTLRLFLSDFSSLPHLQDSCSGPKILCVYLLKQTNKTQKPSLPNKMYVPISQRSCWK